MADLSTNTQPSGGAPPPAPRTYTEDEVKQIAANAAKTAAEGAVAERFAQLMRENRSAVIGGLPRFDNGVAGSDYSGQKAIVVYEREWDARNEKFVTKASMQSHSPETKEFAKALVASMKGKSPQSTFESATQKAYSNQVAESGGLLTPGEYETMIQTLEYANSRILPLCQQFPMTQDTLNWPQQDVNLDVASDVENIDGITFEYIGESTDAIETGEVKFRNRQLTAKKGVAFNLVPNELISDRPDFLGFVASRIGNAAAEHKDRMIVRGTGVGKPQGFSTATGIKTVTRDAAGTVKVKDLLKLDAALHEIADGGQPVYIMRKATQLELPLQTTSSTPNVQIQFNDFTQSIALKPTMNGYRVIRTRHAPALADAGCVFLVDFRAVGVGTLAGYNFETSREWAFKKSQTAIKAEFRWDVIVLWPELIVKLIN